MKSINDIFKITLDPMTPLTPMDLLTDDIKAIQLEPKQPSHIKDHLNPADKMRELYRLAGEIWCGFARRMATPKHIRAVGDWYDKESPLNKLEPIWKRK